MVNTTFKKIQGAHLSNLSSTFLLNSKISFRTISQTNKLISYFSSVPDISSFPLSSKRLFFSFCLPNKKNLTEYICLSNFTKTKYNDFAQNWESKFKNVLKCYKYFPMNIILWSLQILKTYSSTGLSGSLTCCWLFHLVEKYERH